MKPRPVGARPEVRGALLGLALLAAASIPAYAPAAPAGSAQSWICFDSGETEQGPRLILRDATGHETSLRVEEDTVLISYLETRAFGRHPRLSISLGDTNRVLLRPDPGRRRGIASATLVLHLGRTPLPPSRPFDLAVHRVTGDWSSGRSTWANQPTFAEEPVATVRVDPDAVELRVDLTDLVHDWVSGKAPAHGILLRVAKPVPVAAPAPGAPDASWTQPEIRTGTPFTDALPWVDTIADALARARDQKKLVLATVTPVGGRRWVSGFREAASVWKGIGPHPWGDARAMAIDAGLVKERAMMATVFSDPEVAHLVREHLVPVRVRPYTLSFDETGVLRYPDPMPALGISARELGGPALVFARPDGTLVHAIRRMGVFSAPLVRDTSRAVLEREAVRIVPYEAPARDRRLAKARALLEVDRFEAALRLLRRIGEPSPEAEYLLAHLEDRAGETERARELWSNLVRRDGEGAWGGKAALRLKQRELRLAEWESRVRREGNGTAARTETDARERPIEEVLDEATAYLLRTQRADGGWRDPFMDVHPSAGPGSKYDKTVPRTGLVVDALMRVRARLPRRRRELDDAIRRGTELVGRFADDPQPHVWKLTYALHLQVEILRGDPTPAAKSDARRRARRLVAELASCQQQGGWSYMPPPRMHSFNTAPVLLLMEECRELGMPVPRAVTSRAAAFLESLRRDEDARDFAYASNLHHGSVRASSCRTALCELALQTHSGKADLGRLRAAVALFFEHEVAVRATTKVFEAYFSPTSLHDAYHYYFGHYYVARALERLPRDEARRLAARQREILLRQVELDGSFVDAQIQGKSYSTAMALLVLLRDLDAR